MQEEDQKKLNFLLRNVKPGDVKLGNDVAWAEALDGKRKETKTENGKEVLAEIIESKEGQISLNDRIKNAFPEKTKNVAAKNDGHGVIANHLQEIASLESAEDQIHRIIEIAQTKGPQEALKIARHLQNNFVLDESYGGMLEDTVHQKLVEQGLIKRET